MLSQIWTTRWTFRLVITDGRTPTLTTKHCRLPTILPIPHHSLLLTLPILQFQRPFPLGGRCTYPYHCTGLPGFTSRLERNTLLLLYSYCPGVQDLKTNVAPFSRVVDYGPNSLLNTRQVIGLQDAQCILENREKVMWLCGTLKNITGEKLIVILSFVSDPKDMF